MSKQRVRLIASTTHLDSVSNQDACHSFTFSKNTTSASTPIRFNKSFVCATHPNRFDRFRTGGASQDRTDDPLLAKQVLSQLSYGPINPGSFPIMVGLGGLEPPASPLSGVRSNHLSYRPIKLLGLIGLALYRAVWMCRCLVWTS